MEKHILQGVMVHIRINDLENYAKENHVPIMLKDGIGFLTDYIKKNNIKHILEIGSAIGYSSIRMSLVSTDIKVTTIERDDIMYNKAKENINAFNLDNQITLIHGDALDIELTDKYDLIFIDAAKAQYIKFFEKFKHNLKDSGVIVTDNLSFHGLVEDSSNCSRNTKQLVKKIKKYIEFLKDNKEFETEFMSIGDGISISKRK